MAKLKLSGHACEWGCNLDDERFGLYRGREHCRQGHPSLVSGDRPPLDACAIAIGALSLVRWKPANSAARPRKLLRPPPQLLEFGQSPPLLPRYGILTFDLAWRVVATANPAAMVSNC